MSAGIDELRRHFRFFPTMCEGYSPLYASLSPRIADDDEILALVTSDAARRSPVNLLLGAVHFLLLGGAEHELATFYPSVGGRRPPDEAYPVFSDFCRVHRGEITRLASTRTVQTNEVGRCGFLMPALSIAWARGERRPLFLIEIGSSAGLQLLFDRYRYEYTSEASDGGGPGDRHRSYGADSPVVVGTRMTEGVVAALPDGPPIVADRVGIDLAPVDVTNEDATRWVEALIWADQVERVARFRGAIEIARSVRPRVTRADAMDVVPEMFERAPEGTLPCVVHSHVTYQMSRRRRREFTMLVAALGRRRDLAHVSLEWLGDDPGPQLHVTMHGAGRSDTTHLAACHHHGDWMRWLAG